jgi:putative tricarboxylic transport membrane protein
VTPADTQPAARGQRWAAAALTAFGIAAVVGARTLPFGSVTRPGAGFFPMCLAVALTLVSGAVLLASSGHAAADPAAASPPGAHRVRAALTLAALLVYAFALEPLGFGLCTFVLIAFLFRVIEPQPWSVALGGAAVTVIASHVLFRIWLGVRLPLGPWGF